MCVAWLQTLEVQNLIVRYPMLLELKRPDGSLSNLSTSILFLTRFDPKVPPGHMFKVSQIVASARAELIRG